LIDSADVDPVTVIAVSDDSSVYSDFGAVLFPFCGSDYTGAYVSGNGMIAFDMAYDSYGEDSGIFAGLTAITPMWSDFNATAGGDVYLVEYADAVGVYYEGIFQYGTTNAVWFSAVLLDTGGIVFQYGDLTMMTANDGFAGWSCGAAGSDIDWTAGTVEDGALGIGTGTESGLYEWFSDPTDMHANDLRELSVWACGPTGADVDGDGWSDTCGDLDDADATVHP
jgi:hypothetical protein